jgi:hypothetical protein
MNTTDLRKNSKEELIIYIEKLSRDMVTIQQENLELRRDCQQQESRIQFLENIIYMYENNHKNI